MAGRLYSQLLGTLRTRFLTTDLTAKYRPNGAVGHECRRNDRRRRGACESAGAFAAADPTGGHDAARAAQMREELVAGRRANWRRSAGRSVRLELVPLLALRLRAYAGGRFATAANATRIRTDAGGFRARRRSRWNSCRSTAAGSGLPDSSNRSGSRRSAVCSGSPAEPGDSSSRSLSDRRNGRRHGGDRSACVARTGDLRAGARKGAWPERWRRNGCWCRSRSI